MKLGDLVNERGLDFLGRILEPAVGILTDVKCFSAIVHGKYLLAIKHISQDHKEEALKLLAAWHDVPESEYEATPTQMLKSLKAILTDDEVVDFFGSWGQVEAKSPGSVSENTAAQEES